MRELKFRAWFNRFNKMVYEVDKDYLNLWKGYWDGQIHIVYPDDGDVIEQYTGLKDKNGKEIYEGDIVEVCAMKMCGQILYDDVEYFAYLIVGFISDEPLKIHLGNFDWHKLEIIGNIHENPELLKEQE